MSISGDVSEQLMRMSIHGAESAVKLTGAGAKNVALLLISALKGPQKTEGAVRLKQMLEDGSKVLCYDIGASDLSKFKNGSREYGFVYNVVKHKGEDFKSFDVFIKEADLARFERMCRRYDIHPNTDITIEDKQRTNEEIERDPLIIEDGDFPDLSPTGEPSIRIENFSTEQKLDILLGKTNPNPGSASIETSEEQREYSGTNHPILKNSLSEPESPNFGDPKQRISIKEQIRTIRTERERLGRKNIKLTPIRSVERER